jgi:hypothetical protein
MLNAQTSLWIISVYILFVAQQHVYGSAYQGLYWTVADVALCKCFDNRINLTSFIE